MPIIGRISVGDGATFTPDVTDEGVLTWTNNKNLENPDPVDIAQAVVDKKPGWGIPIGYEYFTINPNIPQGSLPLFGGEYDRATYPDLWAWVQTQTGYLKTEAQWQALSTSNAGNVPYYSDGDGSTTFRVPSLKCWVKGANGTVSEVGSYLQAGLPNITGETFLAANTNPSRWVVPAGATGAFYSDTESGSAANFAVSSGYAANVKLRIDASRSSSIYGNSTTVQPPSIVGMWLVKAYGVVEDTGSIDEQQYIDDRFNASKQYTDDEVNDAVTTLNDDISAINTRLGLIYNASGNSTTVSAIATLCEITTHPAGVYLITSFMDLDYSGTGMYINAIIPAVHTGVSTRNISNSGGGNCAVLLTELNENEVVNLRGYQTASGTMRGNLKMVRLA